MLTYPVVLVLFIILLLMIAITLIGGIFYWLIYKPVYCIVSRFFREPLEEDIYLPLVDDEDQNIA